MASYSSWSSRMAMVDRLFGVARPRFKVSGDHRASSNAFSIRSAAVITQLHSQPDSIVQLGNRSCGTGSASVELATGLRSS
jgi:hypothetical protein